MAPRCKGKYFPSALMSDLYGWKNPHFDLIRAALSKRGGYPLAARRSTSRHGGPLAPRFREERKNRAGQCPREKVSGFRWTRRLRSIELIYGYFASRCPENFLGDRKRRTRSKAGSAAWRETYEGKCAMACAY